MENKKTMEDMVPHKKSVSATSVPIKNVTPAIQKKADKKPVEEFFAKKHQVPDKEYAVRRWYGGDGVHKNEGRPKLKYIALFSAVAAAAVFLGGMKLFSRAIIQVSPRAESFEVNAEFGAGRQDNLKVGLETLRFESELEKSSAVTGLQKVNKSASGRIIIYNIFSKEPQVLVRRTRLETAEGKIYRLGGNITVPGADFSGDKVKPGSIEVEVTADAPGDSYNIGLTDFTIPGFKGTARYDKFYARSKTPMSGGFSGTSAVVTKDDMDALQDNIRQELNEKFLAQVRQELPSGFMLPEGGAVFTVEEVRHSHKIGDPTSVLTTTVKASFVAFALKIEDIERQIIDKYINDAGNAEIKIQNLDTISYIVKSPDFANQRLKLQAEGEARAVWQFDESKLKDDLIYAPRKSRLNVFGKYPEIVRAQIVFWPSWWHVFPKSPGKISIVVEPQS